MLCHQIMHPVGERQSVLSPSIAIQIPTLLCRFQEKKMIKNFPRIFLKIFPTHLNTENTRAILPIARILFLMTSLRKLAALPARRMEKEGGKIS